MIAHNTKIFSTTLITASILSIASNVSAHESADPVLAMLAVNQLERSYESIGDHQDDITRWDADAWLGKDIDKLWFKTEGEVVDGNREDSEVQVLYSRAIAPYWDVQGGWRGNFGMDNQQQWFALGLQGLAPYFFELDTALFISEDGQSALRIDGEYELLLSQRLVLNPEIELNFYGQNDDEFEQGRGLATAELSLRLRYEISREFAPYIGINWSKKYGDTAAMARKKAKDIESANWLIGLKFWF